MNLLTKQKQTQRTNLWLPGGKGRGKGSLGSLGLTPKNCISLYCTPVTYNTVHQLYINKKRKKKVTRHTKRQKTQFEERKQALEPNSDMAKMLE